MPRFYSWKRLNSRNAGSILNCNNTEFATSQISQQQSRIKLLLYHWMRCGSNHDQQDVFKEEKTNNTIDADKLSSDILKLIYSFYEHRKCLYLKNGQTFHLKAGKINEYLAIKLSKNARILATGARSVDYEIKCIGDLIIAKRGCIICFSNGLKTGLKIDCYGNLINRGRIECKGISATGLNNNTAGGKIKLYCHYRIDNIGGYIGCKGGQSKHERKSQYECAYCRGVPYRFQCHCSVKRLNWIKQRAKRGIIHINGATYIGEV